MITCFYGNSFNSRKRLSCVCYYLSLLPENKVSYLLNPKIIEHISIIDFFLKRSLELRAEVS